MDEKTSELMTQLVDRLIAASDGQVTEIIQEARDEALAEAKAIIKGMVIQAVLEHAVRELESARNKTASGEDPVRQEIEAIRRKIGENERLLSDLKAPPIVDEGGAPSNGMEEGHGYYVYGIVEHDSGQSLERLPEEGIDSAFPVYALPYQAIQAIVSRASLQEFGQKALEANLNDMEWLETKVYAHQSVLETTLASHTLIPLRFCTIYKSESRVQEILARHYDDFVDALARLEGKQEWGVKVYCDGETLAQRVGESSDRARELKAEMDEKSSGAAYFLKKKLEETVAEEVERVGDEYAQRSHDRLSSHAEETVVNPLQSKEITGRKEAMILNGAYLVAEERLTAFRAELESLEEESGDLGFSYEMTGPWPPYNFVSTGFEEGVADE